MVCYEIPPKSIKKRLEIAMFCILVMVFAAVAYCITESFHPLREEVKVTPLAIQNEKAEDCGIELAAAYLDGKKIPVEIVADSQWCLEDGRFVWQNYEETQSGTTNPETFILTIPVGYGRALEFVTNSNKGMVKIEYADIAQIIDRYSQKDSQIRVNIQDTVEIAALRIMKLIKLAIYAIIVFLLSCMCLMAICLFKRKEAMIR